VIKTRLQHGSVALPQFDGLGRPQLLLLATTQFSLLALAYSLVAFAMTHMEKTEHPYWARVWLQKRLFRSHLLGLLVAAVATLSAALWVPDNTLMLAIYVSTAALALAGAVALRLYGKVSALDSPDEILAVNRKQFQSAERRYYRLRLLNAIPGRRVRQLLFTALDEDWGEPWGFGMGFAHLVRRTEAPRAELYGVLRRQALAGRTKHTLVAIESARDDFDRLRTIVGSRLDELISGSSDPEGNSHSPRDRETREQMMALINSLGQVSAWYAGALQDAAESASKICQRDIEDRCRWSLEKAVESCEASLDPQFRVLADELLYITWTHRVLQPLGTALAIVAERARLRGDGTAHKTRS
jgi:hypothetical protein